MAEEETLSSKEKTHAKSKYYPLGLVFGNVHTKISFLSMLNWGAWTVVFEYCWE